MEHLADFRPLPAALFDILRRENISLAAVMADKAGIITAFVTGQTGSPLPFSVSIPAVFQPVSFILLQYIKYIGYHFPVAQIL